MNEHRVRTYAEAATEAIMMAMERDDRVILIGEGVDHITGVYGHVFPSFEKFGPSRVIDAPISENGLTGFAIGAALDGLRPVLIHQRNDFMLLAMDQMMNQAAKLRYASGGRHAVSLTILSFIARKPGEGAQHSQSLQSVFGHFPGVSVCMPATPKDAKGMILAAIADDDPTIVLEHRSLFEEMDIVPEEYYAASHGADTIASGSDITIVSMSASLADILKAMKASELSGVSAEIIDLRWIRPFDAGAIIRSVEKTQRLLVVDTGWKMFGVAAEIIASVCERHDGWKCLPQRITLPDTPCPASHYSERRYHPDERTIAQKIRSMMRT